jgi:predicted NUDIX family NTP pyrophosphohydrolase
VLKTCGVLITDGINLLICHPTNETRWDIPKGRQDANEDDITTAIRETREETGLIISQEQLTLLGTWLYKPGKELTLFLYLTKNMPAITTLVCSTNVITNTNSKFPEMDAYNILPFEEAVLKFNQELRKIIESILLDNKD